MGAWLKVILVLLACCALSAALAAPSRRQFLDAAGGCAISLGCDKGDSATLLLSVLGLASPFVIFAAGAFALSRTLKAAEASNHRLVAVVFGLLPPALLLLYLFS